MSFNHFFPSWHMLERRASNCYAMLFENNFAIVLALLSFQTVVAFAPHFANKTGEFAVRRFTNLFN